MLRKCLASLQRQQFAASELRIALIVIDNEETHSARSVFEDVMGTDTSCSLVHCAEVGIPIARNAAIEAALRAGADYIAFIDDDEVAPPTWLASLLRALQDSTADAAQGGVRRRPPGAEDLLMHSTSTSDPVRWEPSESLATCNVIFKASLAREPLALRFDESMRFTGGSDREFFMRARKRGAVVVRVHGVDVFEEIAPGRECLRYECSRAFAAGNNYFARMVRNEPAGRAALRIGMRTFERSVSGFIKLTGSSVIACFRPAKALTQARKGCANLCFAAGCLSPILGLRAYPYRIVQGA